MQNWAKMIGLEKMLPGPDLTLPRAKISEIRELLKDLELDSPNSGPIKAEPLEFEREVQKKVDQLRPSDMRKDLLKKHSDLLYSSFMEQNQDKEYQKMQEFRKSLPSYQIRQEILDTIENNQVVLIKGETGSGKTTQVPQYILDHFLLKREGARCRIICSQPRRIASMSVADRVAAERYEYLGQSIGYQIRLDKKPPRYFGSILFCTTQVIQKFMESDPTLSAYSHIIIDECHERQVHIDLLLGLLKTLVKYRKDLKVILMSATLQADQISQFFANCPTIHIPGKMYPVQEVFLGDLIDELNLFDLIKFGKERRRRNSFNSAIDIDLILELIFHICEDKPPGAILVFLPGLSVITSLYNKIKKSKQFSADRFVIYTLHSRLSGTDQRSIFQKPPDGVRKIILATQIAECSITVDDVVYIVNSGFYKKSYFDKERYCHVLEEQMITKANETQRKGRAGRTQAGVCYHLYTKLRSSELEPFEKPEILCVRLEEAILALKSLHIENIRVFFQSLIDVPEESMLKISVEFLERLNALDEKGELTPLGYHLARIPVGPQIGKMILLGSIFSCFDPISTVAVSLSYKSPFYHVIDKDEEILDAKIKLSENTYSDHLANQFALQNFRKCPKNEKKDFCDKNFLSWTFLKQIEKMKGQFARMLKSSKFVLANDPSSEANNRYSRDNDACLSLICGGLYPNVAFKRPKILRRGKYEVNCETFYGPAKLVDGSINKKAGRVGFIAYHMRQEFGKSGSFLLDASDVSPYAVVFFGDQIKFWTDLNCLTVGNFARLVFNLR